MIKPAWMLMCMYFIRVDGLFISSAITVVQFGISCKPHFAITNVCCNASYVQHAYRRQIGMKRKPRTPRAPPPGATRNAKIAGSPRVKNITKNRAPSWATNMNRNNRNAGMIASSEDVDQAKLEAFEKNHAKNRSNSGMKFSRRGSMWKNANKGWNTTALKDIDPSIEQNSKILKSKPKWGSYSTRGVCNYVSPRGPPGSLGKPPRPFTPCWAYTLPQHQEPSTLEKLKAKRKAMNETIGIDFDGKLNFPTSTIPVPLCSKGANFLFLTFKLHIN